jgi:hypothetical protein
MTQSPVLEAERRAWRYWFADGLFNIIAGVGLLAMGMLFHILHRPRPLELLPRIVMGLLYFCLLLIILVILSRLGEIVEWLKAKITYPRTGYATPPYLGEEETKDVDFDVLSPVDSNAESLKSTGHARRGRVRRAWLGGVLIGVAIAAIMFIDNPWICVFPSIAMAVAFWFGKPKEARLSGLVLGGLLLMGVFMAAFTTIRSNRLEFFTSGMGLLFVLDGMIALIRYIRRNPVAQP